MTDTVPGPPGDLPALARRLLELTGTEYEIAACKRASSGFANTTWILDSQPHDLVVKVQSTPSVVHQRDPGVEPAILEGLAGTTVPVPTVVARDPAGEIFDAPWFAMHKVDGRSLPDDAMTSYVGGGWYADAPAEYRSRIWTGFVDALADLHTSPATAFGPTVRGGSHTLVLNYLEASLLDGAGHDPVPLQRQILAWLREHVPDGADDLAVPCMADARMANLLERDALVVALVDWELAWIGNPCGDIGYHLYMDGRYAQAAGRTLTGHPNAAETWLRWEQQTGYTASDPAYWEVFGGLVMAITATRAIVLMQEQGVLPSDVDVESMNDIVGDLAGRLSA
jgi:aminoglycoside phosphotransferase (APT) family kinase protein